MKRRAGVKRDERGFSLLEIMVVVLILGLITGGVLSQMGDAVKRGNAEQTKLDDLGEARDFIDFFFRDINEIGYPNIRMVNPATFTPALTTQTTYTWASAYINDPHFAIGLVRIGNTEVQFEADTNGDGNVQSVYYKVNGNGNCSLCLQRSQVAKVTGDPSDLTVQVPNWGTEVNDVINNNANPIFTYYKADGTVIAASTLNTPIDITTSANASIIASIKTIKMSLQIRNNAIRDLQTGLPLETDFQGEVSLNNCSMATSSSPVSCQ